MIILSSFSFVLQFFLQNEKRKVYNSCFLFLCVEFSSSKWAWLEDLDLEVQEKVLMEDRDFNRISKIFRTLQYQHMYPSNIFW